MPVRVDTVYVDPTKSIQSAIDSLPDTGGIIQLAAGVYNITETIVFPTDRPVELRGEGRWSYTELADRPAPGTVINNQAAANDVDTIQIRGNYQSVSNLSIVTESASGALGGVGVRVGYTGTEIRHCRLENLDISGHGSWLVLFEGVETANDGRWTIESVVRNVTLGHNRADGGMSIETGCTTITLDGCEFDNVSGTELQVYGADTVVVKETTFDAGSANAHVRISGGVNAARSVTFQSCYFEDFTNDATHFITFAAGNVISPAVRDCIFIRNNAGVQFIKAVKVANGCYCYGLDVSNPCGYAQADSTGYAGTDCISVGTESYGAQVRGGIVETGAHAHFYKMVVLDSGHATQVFQPTLTTTDMAAAHIVGKMALPQATKAQLVASATGRAGQIAWNTTDSTLCICTGTWWYPVTVGAVLS